MFTLSGITLSVLKATEVFVPGGRIISLTFTHCISVRVEVYDSNGVLCGFTATVAECCPNAVFHKDDGGKPERIESTLLSFFSIGVPQVYSLISSSVELLDVSILERT